MTEEELRKIISEAHDTGVRSGIELSFKCIKNIEGELIKQTCDHEFDRRSILCSDPPKKQCKKCYHTEII